MGKYKKCADDLLNFIQQSPTPFHVVDTAKNILLENNFSELNQEEKWKIKNGEKYFLTVNNSALIAFITGTESIENTGYRLIGAHTDSPTFRIKPDPEIIEKDKYLKINTEVYGGPILSTWMDRPLALAGRVALSKENSIIPEIKLININRPLMIIPNLAIHLERDLNKGKELNKQKDMLPLLSIINEEFNNNFKKILAEELDTALKDILDYDLFLYEHTPGKLTGLNNEFISASRLDDLAMVHAGINALCHVNPSPWTSALVLFNNEEIGSRTIQGADSPMLTTILERINLGMGKNREEHFMAINNSFLISADMAHAVHPNHLDKHDPTNQPIINKGPVIKINANFNYTTDSESSAIYERICQLIDIPVQRFVNRSDQKGGSTIGPINSTQINIKSLDIGNPILAMHSIRELGGVQDHYHIIKSFIKYYNG